MAEKCSYCGELGHSIQQCPKWKGKEVATATQSSPVTVQELRRALDSMKNQLAIPRGIPEPIGARVATQIFESTLYAAKTTMKDATERRVFIQDFAAALNRHGLLRSELVDAFMRHGYVYMEAEHSSESSSPKRIYLSPAAFTPLFSSSVDWKAVWQKATEKLKTDRSKVTDVARAEIYSTAQLAGVPIPFYEEIGRDLHTYPKYDAYAMWVNPEGGFLSFAKPEDKSKIEHFLFAVGQFLDVIPAEAEFVQAPSKASLYEFLKVTDVGKWTRKQILDHVKDKENWKKPTSEIRVKADQKDKVLDALSYYLGGAEAKDLKDGTWVISSRGYYYYIGA